jgi:hypothetical protein
MQLLTLPECESTNRRPDRRSCGSTPVFIDETKACIARVYDAALGGKDNYEVDREVVRQVKRAAPECEKLAWDCPQSVMTEYIELGGAGRKP